MCNEGADVPVDPIKVDIETAPKQSTLVRMMTCGM